MATRKFQIKINEHMQDVNKNRPVTEFSRLFQTNDIESFLAQRKSL